jgi:ubiquinone/menaquinone biosynthesis C-methylase UbiE
MSKEIENYFKTEWQMFADDSGRAGFLLDITKDLNVRRVLDVGCGAGQEMLPFVQKYDSFCCGIDVSVEAISVANQMYKKNTGSDKINFLSAQGEEIPFADDIFDVVICRVALPFMNVNAALSEISRVLSKDGRFFLKIQAPNYYWWKIGNGLKNRKIKFIIHAVRVLIAGFWFSLSGKQSYNRLTAGGETFISRQTLERDLKMCNLEIAGEMPDTNSKTPSFIIKKVK